MEAQKSYMQMHFARLETVELLRLFAGEQITAAAHELVGIELQSRGIDIAVDLSVSEESRDSDTANESRCKATREKEASASPDDVDLGAFQTLRQFLDPTQAHMVAACLQANGVPVFVADANLVQANMLLGVALGGVRLQVPASLFDEAKILLAAYERGEFQLNE
jgi:hypothetical protein